MIVLESSFAADISIHIYRYLTFHMSVHELYEFLTCVAVASVVRYAFDKRLYSRQLKRGPIGDYFFDSTMVSCIPRHR